MIIPASAIAAYALTTALPAVWKWFVAHTMTHGQLVEKYCKPVDQIGTLNEFQQAQYNKQCGQLGVYIFQATPVKKTVKPELIGPPEPEGKP